MGIVLVGFRCVSGKQVFVLISGCRMFDIWNKEEGRQMGREEEHSETVGRVC